MSLHDFSGLLQAATWGYAVEVPVQPVTAKACGK